MKKLLLTVGFILSASFASADRGTLILRTPQEYQIMYISPNGLWAAGVYQDYAYTPFAFRMSLESGEIEMLSSSASSVPAGIANDGTVTGNFASTEISPNGAPVDAPGYYTDRWHTLPLAGKFEESVAMGMSLGGGIAGGISPDGVWMTGGSLIDKKLHPVIWKNGEVYKDLYDGTDAVPLCISPDGQTIGGWKYVEGPDYGVRNAFLWKANETNASIVSKYGTPWSRVSQFSTDGKKALVWAGWNEYGNLEATKATMDIVYDLQKKDFVTTVQMPETYCALDVYSMADDGTIVGEMTRGEMDVAAIIKDGQPYYATDWFKEQGIYDFSQDPRVLFNTELAPYPLVIRTIGISADAKAMGFTHYTPDGFTQSCVLLLDQEITHRAPCGLKAKALRGERKVRLEWKEPLSNAAAVKQYQVYRGGQKVAEVAAASHVYMDDNLAVGDYSYSVSALYNDGTESVLTGAVSAQVKEVQKQAPYDLFARQRGFRGALVQWHAPRTNHITKGYFDEAEDEVSGFGGGDNSFEVAVRYSREEIAAYKGRQLKAVEFYPMSSQLAWDISLYEIAADGTLTTLATQRVNQKLELGQLNTVELEKPFVIGDLKNDLLVAVSPTVSFITASYNVVGMVYGKSVPGATDLLRLKNAPAFESFYEMGLQDAYNNELTWAIDIVVENEGVNAQADEVKQYNVYVDNAFQTTVTDTRVILPQLALGQRTVGVEAVYADGSKSPVETFSFNLEADKNVYAVNDVNIGITEGQPNVSFSWQAPEDYDTHLVTYSGETRGTYSVMGNSTENYALQALASYPASRLRGYGGMQIKAFRFFPTCDAEFSFTLYCNGQEVAYGEADDYTLNQWNEVPLEAPFTLVEGMAYELIIDCYDATPEMAPLGIDNQSPFNGMSNLVATDGENFSGLDENGVFGNWMMGLVLYNPEQLPLNIEGYNVLVDGKQLNNNRLTDTKFDYTFPAVDGQRHAVSIATQYQGVAAPVVGRNTGFIVGDPDGIYGVTIAPANKLTRRYDLQGRPILHPVRGINIVDGKKVLNR